MARDSLYPPSVDPGHPELPAIPIGWKQATFGDLLDVVERPIKLNPSQSYALVTAKRNRGGIVSRGDLTGDEILTKTQFQVKAGDFLISRRQVIHGACGVVPQELEGAIVSNEYAVLRTRANLLMEYLAYYSNAAYFQRACFHSSHGVDVEKMVFKLDRWLRLPVNVPPLPEQRKIAAILASVDDTIAATQAVIDQLQIVKKAMMEELLTRGIPGRHTRFKQTEIGEVPEGWEVVKLGEVCERMFVGIAQATTHAYVETDGVPLIRNTNIRPNRIVADDLLYISQEFAEEMASKSLRAGDVLSARTGYPGTSAIVPESLHGAQCFTMLVSRPGPRLQGRFLAHVMNSSLGAKIVLHGQAGGAQQNLNVSVFKEAQIALPPRIVQEQVSSILDGVFLREGAEDATLVGLQSLKSALLSSLLTGEIRVPVDADLPTQEACP